MRYNYIRGATKAEDGYDRPACYQVFRDEYRPGWDHAAWYIRENEVRPLHELLGSLLAADSATRVNRYAVGELHGSRVVWEMNECDGRPDPRPLTLERIAEMLNERTS